MNLYIDKENVFSLIRSMKKDPQKYEDCIRLMRRNLDVKFNFSPDGLSPVERELFDMFFEDLNYAGTDKSFLETAFPQRPLKANCYNQFSMEHLRSVYLLDDPKVGVVIDKGCLLIGGVGDELEVLSRLFFDDYQYNERIDIEQVGGNWNFLSKHALPTSDIILVDQYILCEVDMYKRNLYAILDRLTSGIHDYKVNIVIVITRGNIDHYSPEKIQSDIENQLLARIGVKPNVTIVELPRQQREHDRTIVTNFMRYHSGDTFNYFNSRGGMETRGRDFNISSLASEDNRALVNDLLEDLQYKINLRQQVKADYFTGNGECNFLDIH